MTENTLPLGLSYGDVLLIPGYSKVVTRKLINLKTRFSKNIELNLPIVSANMDTVTESKMAIAMAREGGIGVIHRFMSLEQQVEEVSQVKRAESFVINNPIVISKTAVMGDAFAVMKKNDVSSLLIIDDKGVLEGILTARDSRFCNDSHKKVVDIMTPKEKLITAPPQINKEDALKIFDRYKIEKLPLVDERGMLKGLIAAADFTKTSKYRKAAKDHRGRLLVAAAIGVKEGTVRAEKLIEAGADALVIDIAHGHHQSVIDLIKILKNKFPNVDVVAGNVATAEGTIDLIAAGADAIKVGIGAGKACSTRIVAGAGVPQFTAVLECSRAARRHGIPIIADGGIVKSGDLTKAIGAGGSTAMIGGLFAATKESPGDYFIEDGVAYKMYRGLASRDASYDRDFFEQAGTIGSSAIEPASDRRQRAAEGITTKISYRGDVGLVIRNLIDGLQSGMSYGGAESIADFWQKAQFIRVTDAGRYESAPRP